MGFGYIAICKHCAATANAALRVCRRLDDAEVQQGGLRRSCRGTSRGSLAKVAASGSKTPAATMFSFDEIMATINKLPSGDAGKLAEASEDVSA